MTDIESKLTIGESEPPPAERRATATGDESSPAEGTPARDPSRPTLVDSKVTFVDRKLTIGESNVTIDDRNVTIDEGSLTIDDVNATIVESSLTIGEGHASATGTSRCTTTT